MEGTDLIEGAQTLLEQLQGQAELDVVTNGDDRENMLANAPEQRDGAFVVPRTVE